MDSWRLARALRKLTPRDLFFSPGYNTPLFCSAPFVFTIHDLSHIYSPENTSPQIQVYYATIMKRACHRAARILTVSEFTRDQIIEWSGISSENVINVGCGVDAAYSPHGDSYGLAFPYILCVSNRKRHKNELRLVEAFAQSGVASGTHLVFTGESSPDLSIHIKRRQLEERVEFLGLVPESRLPSLYRGAQGFGVPVPLRGLDCQLWKRWLAAPRW